MIRDVRNAYVEIGEVNFDHVAANELQLAEVWARDGGLAGLRKCNVSYVDWKRL